MIFIIIAVAVIFSAVGGYFIYRYYQNRSMVNKSIVVEYQNISQPPTYGNFVNSSLGKEIELKIHQTAKIEVNGGMYGGGYDFTIVFVRVKEDSRCPESLECYHPGRAEIVFSISKSMDIFKINKEVILHADAKLAGKNKDTVEYDGHTIELIDLKPYPKSRFSGDLNKIDYVAVIKATKSVGDSDFSAKNDKKDAVWLYWYSDPDKPNPWEEWKEGPFFEVAPTEKELLDSYYKFRFNASIPILQYIQVRAQDEEEYAENLKIWEKNMTWVYGLSSKRGLTIKILTDKKFEDGFLNDGWSRDVLIIQ